MRKRIVKEESAPASRAGELDVEALATVVVSSEAPGSPVENAFDGRRGPGATRWVAGESGVQTLTLEFDAPQLVRQVLLEVEEREVGRTQDVVLSISVDGGKSFRELLRQEFNFSPPATSFEREEWTLHSEPLSHLRLRILPDKGGGDYGRASITTLALK